MNVDKSPKKANVDNPRWWGVKAVLVSILLQIRVNIEVKVSISVREDAYNFVAERWKSIILIRVE